MADTTFILKPIQPFRLDLTVWVLRRTHKNIIDRWDGKYYQRVLTVNNHPFNISVAEVRQGDAHLLEVRVFGKRLPHNIKDHVEKYLEKALGLKIDLIHFYRFIENNKRLKLLAEKFKGFKPPQFPTIFETLVNGIACQQITLSLGIILLNRLAEKFGPKFDSGVNIMYGSSEPAHLASAQIEDITSLGFSKNKALFIIGLSQAVLEGSINVESVAHMADKEALAYLQKIKGVGQWTAEYALLRGLGRTHVFPGNDSGAQKKLQKWLKLKEAPKHERLQRILAKWQPYAGLVYFHLLLEHLAQQGRITYTE